MYKKKIQREKMENVGSFSEDSKCAKPSSGLWATETFDLLVLLDEKSENHQSQ